MDQIQVLGIRLTDGSVKDAIKIAWKYMGNGAVNTIFYVSSRILVEAGKLPECKEWLESMDMTVFGELGVLPETVEGYRERKKEIEEDAFFRELVKRIARNHSRVLLIADSQEMLEKLREDMLGIRDNVLIAKSLVADTGDEADVAELVNEINDAAPDIILSQLPNLYQMRVITENKKLINASIWVALLYERDPASHKGGFLSRMRTRFYQRLLQRKVNRFEDDNDEN